MLGHIFRTEAKRSIATRGKRPGSARAASGARQVEDLNGQGLREGRDEGGRPFKPQTVLLALLEASAGGTNLAKPALLKGVVLGEPWCA